MHRKCIATHASSRGGSSMSWILAKNATICFSSKSLTYFPISLRRSMAGMFFVPGIAPQARSCPRKSITIMRWWFLSFDTPKDSKMLGWSWVSLVSLEPHHFVETKHVKTMPYCTSHDVNLWKTSQLHIGNL